MATVKVVLKQTNRQPNKQTNKQGKNMPPPQYDLWGIKSFWAFSVNM